MSARQWKPGDVALRLGVSAPQVALCVARCAGDHAYSGEPHWHMADGWDPLDPVASVEFRPLVVIDPEDRERVERLLTRYLSEYDGMDSRPQKGEIDCMQKSLRSLVADPKPDEPDGLGAVVEDATGGVWVRSERAVMNCWTNSKTGERFMWHKIDVARVLSEGWSE